MNGKNENDGFWIVNLFLLCMYVALLVKTAWITDDSLITCRTIYNFVHGHGLCWNAGERVQAYTHPLWLFTITPFYLLSGEFSKTIMLLSVMLSTIGVAFVSFKLAVNQQAAMLVLVAILFSKAFVDYSTSGLENPLSHLLIAFFALQYFRDEISKKTVFFSSLILALALLNRLDVLLLYLPAYCLILYQSKKCGLHWWKFALMGFLPFFLWEVFSLLYYGFLVPNTFFAKLHTGIPKWEMVQQGCLYFLDSIDKDFVTLPIIAVSTIIAFRSQITRNLCWVLGIVLYLAYIVWVGGDFMRGRFFSLPFFAALILLSRIQIQTIPAILLTIVLAFFGCISSHPNLFSTTNYVQKETQFGIANERGYYYSERNLFLGGRKSFFKPLVTDFERPQDKQIITVRAGAGIKGLQAGPYVHVIDTCALGDPLLSKIHLKDVNFETWRVGHYLRNLPYGYMETVNKSSNTINHRALAKYYDHLSLIIQGNLFSLERLMTILKMNIGCYDHYLDQYNSRDTVPQKMNLSDLDTYLDQVEWRDSRVHILYEAGIKIDLPKTLHSREMDLSFDNNDVYLIQFKHDGKNIGELKVGPTQEKIGVVNYPVSIPESIANPGYDSLLIRPVEGDKIYCIGHLIFK